MMLPTLGRVFLLETLVEGTFELVDGCSKRGMEMVGGFVLLSSEGAPDNEAQIWAAWICVPGPGVYLEVGPKVSPGKAMEGRVVDIEIMHVNSKWGWK